MKIILTIIAFLLIGRCLKEKYYLDYEWVTHHTIVDRLNKIAKPTAKILTIEVQWKYYMRVDMTLLSLDGITDGKVNLNNLSEFIQREKPDYYMDVPSLQQAFFIKSFLSSVHRDTIVDGISFIRHDGYYELLYQSR